MMSFDVTCSHKSFILFVGSVVVVLVSYVKHFESLCMKCATHIKWPCLASLHAGHSKVFLNEPMPAVRTDHMRVAVQGLTVNCQVLFYIGRYAQLQWLCGWLLRGSVSF